MTQSTPAGMVELIERLRSRDQDWQRQTDGWAMAARCAGQPWDTETERTVRSTLYGEAADALQASVEEVRRLREALEWIASRAEKLRKGTDDWFELVEFEAFARQALNPTPEDAG